MAAKIPVSEEAGVATSGDSSPFCLLIPEFHLADGSVPPGLYALGDKSLGTQELSKSCANGFLMRTALRRRPSAGWALHRLRKWQGRPCGTRKRPSRRRAGSSGARRRPQTVWCSVVSCVRVGTRVEVGPREKIEDKAAPEASPARGVPGLSGLCLDMRRPRAERPDMC